MEPGPPVPETSTRPTGLELFWIAYLWSQWAGLVRILSAAGSIPAIVRSMGVSPDPLGRAFLALLAALHAAPLLLSFAGVLPLLGLGYALAERRAWWRVPGEDGALVFPLGRAMAAAVVLELASWSVMVMVARSLAAVAAEVG